MTNVIPLRKRSTSFYTVRKVAGGWAMVLVTPGPARPLQTALEYFPSYATAAAATEERAVRALLPFKEPRARARTNGGAAPDLGGAA